MPDRPLRASLWPAFAWSWPGRHMQRREFITLLGGATVWPLPLRAQQRRPVIGFLGTVAQALWAKPVAAFEERLRERGWIDGRTIKIIYRWGEGRPERFAEIATEFVNSNVDVSASHSGRQRRFPGVAPGNPGKQ